MFKYISNYQNADTTVTLYEFNEKNQTFFVFRKIKDLNVLLKFNGFCDKLMMFLRNAAQSKFFILAYF